MSTDTQAAKPAPKPPESLVLAGASAAPHTPAERQKLLVRAVDAIHEQESKRGQDPNCRKGVVGPAGELGEFQVTPAWREDAHRITGLATDPYDTERTRYHVYRWLKYYQASVGAWTVRDLCELYKRGPTGYREWVRAESYRIMREAGGAE